MAHVDWDCVVITLGNEKQRELCSGFIDAYSKKYGCRIKLVTDSQDCRIGSGGAVLNAIRSFDDEGGVYGKRILIINSGGMSKRAFNYTLRGKVFADVRVDENGDVLTLFDIIFQNLSDFPSKFKSGLVVCCADIPVDVSTADCMFDKSIGFCVPCDFVTASRHGVMFKNGDGILSEYLHKKTPGQIEKKCREYSCPALLDTGLVFFSSDAVSVLCEMAYGKDSLPERLASDNRELSLYSDIIEQMALQTPDGTEELKGLGNLEMRVCVLDAPFTHYGTVSEATENIGSKVLNSYIHASASVGSGTVIDNSEIGIGCVIGKDCLVSSIILEDVIVPDRKAVCGIKLTDGSYVSLVIDADENPKAVTANGVELWNEPRFVRGVSFTDSYKMFCSGCVMSGLLSMAYCFENADYSYYREHQKYLYEMRAAGDFEPYINLRQGIADDYFASSVKLTCVRCVSDIVTVKLPLRVNLSGTWSDCMPYCVDNGGAVVNAAITFDGIKPVCVTAEKLSERRIELCCYDSEASLYADGFARLESIDCFDSFSLHKAALSVMGFTNETLLEDGFKLTIGVRGVPKGSGLGTSSTLLAGCIKALGRLFGADYSDSDIIRMVFVAEQLMKTGGGWQDQAGTLTDGVKLVCAHAGKAQRVVSKAINISDSFAHELNSRLCLIYTGQRHYGRVIVGDVMRRYMLGKKASLAAFKELIELNDAVIKSFKNESVCELCEAENRHLECLKRLSPLVTNNKTDALVDMCRKYCDCVCVCGAGGGGYLFAILKKTVDIETLNKQVSAFSGEVRKIEIVF